MALDLYMSRVCKSYIEVNSQVFNRWAIKYLSSSKVDWSMRIWVKGKGDVDGFLITKLNFPALSPGIEGVESFLEMVYCSRVVQWWRKERCVVGKSGNFYSWSLGHICCIKSIEPWSQYASLRYSRGYGAGGGGVIIGFYFWKRNILVGLHLDKTRALASFMLLWKFSH